MKALTVVAGSSSSVRLRDVELTDQPAGLPDLRSECAAQTAKSSSDATALPGRDCLILGYEFEVRSLKARKGGRAPWLHDHDARPVPGSSRFNE
jgi:hypothetical protein